MDDLIKRQDAIDALDEQIKYCDKALASFDISLKDEYAVKVEKASLNAFRKTLKYLPFAQPETGRWIPVDDSGVVHFYKCSRCGYLVMGSGRKYCEDCGAKMDLSRKEADLMMKALECYKKMAQKVMDWRG